MFKPENNYIYVRPVSEDKNVFQKSESGLITKAKETTIKIGEIISVADNLSEKFRYLKVGSKIVYNKNEVFNTMADETFFMKAKDVIAIVVANEVQE